MDDFFNYYTRNKTSNQIYLDGFHRSKMISRAKNNTFMFGRVGTGRWTTNLLITKRTLYHLS